MSRLTLARRRGWRWLRPASKIGCSSCGVPVQAQRAALEQARQLGARGADAARSARCAGRTPRAPRRCWRWRRSAAARPRARRAGARAAPTAGRPAASAQTCCAVPAAAPRGRSAGSGWPSSSTQRVLVERALAQRLRQRRRARLRAATRPGGSRARTPRRCRTCSLVSLQRLFARRQRLRASRAAARRRRAGSGRRSRPTRPG